MYISNHVVVYQKNLKEAVYWVHMAAKFFFVEDEDKMTHLISSIYVFEGTPTSLYTPYLLTNSVIWLKTELVEQLSESPLFNPRLSSPNYQQSLDDSLERHVLELSDRMNNISLEIPTNSTT